MIQNLYKKTESYKKKKGRYTMQNSNVGILTDVKFNRPVTLEECAKMHFGAISVRAGSPERGYKEVKFITPSEGNADDKSSMKEIFEPNDVPFSDYIQSHPDTYNDGTPKRTKFIPLTELQLTPYDIPKICNIKIELWGIEDPDLIPITIKDFTICTNQKTITIPLELLCEEDLTNMQYAEKHNDSFYIEVIESDDAIDYIATDETLANRIEIIPMQHHYKNAGSRKPGETYKVN